MEATTPQTSPLMELQQSRLPTGIPAPVAPLVPGPIHFAPAPLQSEGLGQFAAAMAKAQGAMSNAKKDSENPFFKSKYADLAACIDACKEALSANGICYFQQVSAEQGSVQVVTTLVHASGEWIRDVLRLPVGERAIQSYGSAFTYARRYAFAAIVGLAQEDDDANQEAGRGSPSGQHQHRPNPPPPPSGPSPAAKLAAEKAAMSPEQKARAAKVAGLWAKAKSVGVNRDGFGKWSASVLGEAKTSADITDDQVGQLEAAFPDLIKDAEADVPH